jgi:predicted membrane-bound mannosyltransferase
MNSRLPRHETILYLFAFLLALGLRFVRLGELPLTDSEARLALDALSIVKGGSPALSSHVSYTNLTAVLFFVFGSFHFLARFWPALAGTALVFVPLLFREQIKPNVAILLAFFFAIDPALVALSRQA